MPRYYPAPMPQGPLNVEDLRDYIYRELLRISDNFRTGELYSLRLDVLKSEALVPRPRDGDIVYFADTPDTPNQAPGLFEWRNNDWRKL